MKRTRLLHVPLVFIVWGLSSLLLCAASGAETRPRGGTRPRRRPRRPDTSPAVGAPAPDFELVTLEHLLKPADDRAGKPGKDSKGDEGKAGGEKKVDTKTGETEVKKGHVRLSSFKGDRPVVFVLTSYT